MPDGIGDLKDWDVPEGEFCIYGTVYAYPDKADELEAVCAATTRKAMSAAEPGTLYYVLARDRADPTQFHYLERYAGRQAFIEHNSQPLIQKIINPDNKFFWKIEARFGTPIGLDSGSVSGSVSGGGSGSGSGSG
ncbi:hypothetical protein F4808DRAFT_461339 [Astrocystis sublimbata]|nr:hypothetical protein F4808DRAFT_461339 [Astrocystis sublimbata]